MGIVFVILQVVRSWSAPAGAGFCSGNSWHLFARRKFASGWANCSKHIYMDIRESFRRVAFYTTSLSWAGITADLQKPQRPSLAWH